MGGVNRRSIRHFLALQIEKFHIVIFESEFYFCIRINQRDVLPAAFGCSITDVKIGKIVKYELAS